MSAASRIPAARLLVLALLLALPLVLAGCGRKGPPQPPGPPDQVTYPRSYPAR